MIDWADEKARVTVDTPGIVKVFNSAGYCKKCNQVLAGASVDLTDLKVQIADALRQARMDALKEAARAAEGYVGCDNIAADIRALKDKQP